MYRYTASTCPQEPDSTGCFTCPNNSWFQNKTQKIRISWWCSKCWKAGMAVTVMRTSWKEYKKGKKKIARSHVQCDLEGPEGLHQTALKESCKDLVDKVQKRTPNRPLVKQIKLTFGPRRGGDIWIHNKPYGGWLFSHKMCPKHNSFLDS